MAIFSKILFLLSKSWTLYQSRDEQLTLICERFSPVSAHNYEESSFPTCLFEWTLINNSDDSIHVSLMFTIQSADKSGRRMGTSRSMKEGKLENEELFKCLTVERNVSDAFSHQDTIQMCIGASSMEDISILEEFNALNEDHLSSVWKEFNDCGKFSNEFNEKFGTRKDWVKTTTKYLPGHAICVKVQIPPKGSKQIRFNLNWNAPTVRFGPTMDYKYLRHYTKYFTNALKSVQEHTDDTCLQLCERSLNGIDKLKEEISKWHNNVIGTMCSSNSNSISALFNELYYIVDGATIWTNGGELDSNHQTQDTNDYFSYMEGHEYLMHNTYDVHFYASHAMIVNWPLIQLSIQRDIIKAVQEEMNQEVTFYLSNMKNKRKIKGCVPH